MTFWDLVAGRGDAVVLADDMGRSLTVAQLADAAEAVAAGLAGRGITPGDMVSWQLPTRLEAAVLMVALARLGAAQNPIIPILRRREVGVIAERVAPRLIVVPEVWRGFEYGAMARDLGLDALVLNDSFELPTGDPASLPPPPAGDADCKWVYFTSGTTGDPKGARHTDASIVTSAAGIVDGVGFRAGDVYPVAWPIAHIGGATMLTACLRTGARLVLFETFDPATTAERMAAHRPTVLGSAVPFFRAYLDADNRHGPDPLYPALRACTGGGAPLPAEIHREVAEAWGVPGIVVSYGLTEFPIATCAHTDDPPDVLRATVGRPSPGVEVRVVDGELRLRGPQCFLGYADPVMDRDAFDEEAWFRTGDLAELDAGGNVRITGRLKDVIIRNAENISALEVEDVLLRHPDIVDVAVIGLPDARTGERVCAVVVPTPGRALTLAQLAEHCQAAGLARQKCPEEVHLVDALERNPMGKVLKQQLQKRFAT